MRTNWNELITRTIKNNGGRRASTSGIGLDFKTVYYYILNEDGTERGAYTVGGANYKECYNDLCRKIACDGGLKR